MQFLRSSQIFKIDGIKLMPHMVRILLSFNNFQGFNTI